MSLAQQVRFLVDQSHAGSVNAAAKSIGIPQRTLALIASGISESPRLTTIRIIADYYGVRLGWLVNGVGEPPRNVAPICRRCGQPLPKKGKP